MSFLVRVLNLITVSMMNSRLGADHQTNRWLDILLENG